MNKEEEERMMYKRDTSTEKREGKERRMKTNKNGWKEEEGWKER